MKQTYKGKQIKVQRQSTKHSKYVVRETEDQITLYAEPKIKFEMEYHKDIVKKHAIPEREIIGGGEIITQKGETVIWEYSGDYGKVPKEKLEGLAKTVMNEDAKLRKGGKLPLVILGQYREKSTRQKPDGTIEELDSWDYKREQKLPRWTW